MQDNQLNVTNSMFRKNKQTLLNFRIGGRYIIVEEIRRGSFGVIYKAIDLQNPNQREREVAIKQLQISKIQQYELNPYLKNLKLKYIDQEDKILRQFDHPYILPWYKTYKNQDFKLIVTKYCNGGNLYDLIKKFGSLQLTYAINILKQLCEGIQALHMKNIIHRDLKPQNIFIHNSKFMIGDFGLSKVLTSVDQQNTVCGTPYTQAPQVQTGRYWHNADIYSLGVIFYIMISSCKEIEQRAQCARQINTKIFELTLKNGKKAPKEVINFLRKTLKHDPKQRISWNQLKQDQIFKLADLQNLSGSFYLNIKMSQTPPSLKTNRLTFIGETRQPTQYKQLKQQQQQQMPKNQPIICEQVSSQYIQQLKSKIQQPQQTIIYRRLKFFHLHSKIAEFIYRNIIKDIENYKILDLTKRNNLQLMYLLSTRCFIQMSYINIQAYQIKSPTFTQQLNNFITNQLSSLYQKCQQNYNKYSNKLTQLQNRPTTIILDRITRLFTKKQEIQNKIRFMLGIQRLDYKREQQIKQIDKYLNKIQRLQTKDEMIEKKMKAKFMAFIHICNITIQMVENKLFQDIVDEFVYQRI